MRLRVGIGKQPRILYRFTTAQAEQSPNGVFITLA